MSDSNSFDPKRTNEWIALAATIAAISLWFWRNALKECFRWALNTLKAPNNIEDILKTLTEHDISLKTSLARSRITWNGLHIPVWESDSTGLCVFINDYMLNLMKRREHEILGRSWVSVIHEDDREKVAQEWDDAIEQKRDFDLSYRWVSSDGRTIHIHAKANRLLDQSSRILGWVAFVHVDSIEEPKTKEQSK